MAARSTTHTTDGARGAYAVVAVYDLGTAGRKTVPGLEYSRTELYAATYSAARGSGLVSLLCGTCGQHADECPVLRPLIAASFAVAQQDDRAADSRQEAARSWPAGWAAPLVILG